MNNRRNYAYFSDIVPSHLEPSSAAIETRVSATDPAENYTQRERSDYYYGNDDWLSYGTPYD